MLRNVVLPAIALALVAVPVLAHHGWSEYYSTRLLQLSGTIRDAGYEHPHGHIRLEAAGKTWQVVLAPPSRMQSRGLQQGALKAGTSGTVEGFQNRNKPGEMRAERITIDGKTIELR